MSTRRRLLARHALLVAALVTAAVGLAQPAAATPTTTVTLTGPESRGPIMPGPDGRFAFPNVPLKRNSVNKFTVTAQDGAGRTFTKELSITQLSLESVVVSKVTSTPVPPERVIQLVKDGVIEIDDPANFNVSTFAVVLTIGQRAVPIELPIAMPLDEPQGYEVYKLPSDDGNSGGGQPKPQDIQIIVFDQIVTTAQQEEVRIPGVIVIEGAIKSLKEFFSVRLLMLNTSGIFTLRDVRASLEFPDGGLSATLPADGIAAFDDILPGDGDVPGQKEREFIVRGDEIGKRRVRVAFGGVVAGPGIPDDAPVPFNGAAEAEVEVKGPPRFLVRLSHPAAVAANVSYELAVEIKNEGDAAALFASLELDVGADARFADCKPGMTAQDDPVCSDVPGPLVRNLRHLFPGDVVTEKFTVVPSRTGEISSCIGVSDQNVTLQVLVGRIGCLTGTAPATLVAAGDAPTVTVLPFANAQGVGIDSPVTAFFSTKMDLATITAGPGGSFKVFDGAGNVAPGALRFLELRGKSAAVWQLVDGGTNRLAGNTTYTVVLTDDVRNPVGKRLFNPWQSTFTTTSPTFDVTPPSLTLSIEPGVDPTYVIPGQMVRINAYAADQGTGVERVEFRSRDADAPGSTLTLVDQKTIFDAAAQGPTIFALDSAKLVAGHAYELLATAFDAAGNAQDATLSILVAPSAAPPTLRLPADPGQPVLNGISVALTPISVSAGVRTVRYFLDGAATPFATLTLPPFKVTLGSLGLPLGAHTVLAIAEDGLGQTGQDAFEFVLADNPNEPVVRFAGVSNGEAFVEGVRFPVAARAEDPVGVKSLRLALDDPSGPAVGDAFGGVQIDTAVLGAGVHRLYAIATNTLGRSNDPTNPDSYLEFVVRTPPSGPPPPAPALSALGAPDQGRVAVRGTTSAPFTRVDVTNATRGLSVSVTADALGAFLALIEADPGHEIRVVVYDFASSQQPSDATSATVPAPPALLRLEVAPVSISLTTLGATQDLVVSAFFGDGSSANVTSQAVFSSSARTVAAVSAAGRVAPLASGDAVVMASFGGLSAQAQVSVRIVTLERIEVSPASLALVVLGDAQRLVVTGVYSDGSRRTLESGLSFASSLPAVVIASGAGLVTARANGAAQISVQAAGVVPVVVPVTVDTTQDTAPTVVILAPAAGSGVERGAIVPLVARAEDAVGGVVRLFVTVSGATSYGETRQVAPPEPSTTQAFPFTVEASAAIGGTITVTIEAEDTGGKRSAPATRSFSVVDGTAPVVGVQEPAAQSVFNFGDPIALTISASDAVGVTQIRYETSGLATLAGSKAISPSQVLAAATFSLVVPSGPPVATLTIRAFARDAAGNEGAAGVVEVKLTGADITPPATEVTSVAAGTGAAATVSYVVTFGLADLDHVALYFRRNGIGSFSRYTNEAGGNRDGKYVPQTGATGTIVFDSTRMGGDGAYEFFTVGIDRAGNREAPPGAPGAPMADAGATAALATGAPVTTLTSDTEIVGPGLDGRSLRIVGAKVTLVGAHSFQNVELVSGAVLTHRETTQTQAYGLELTAWTVTVDATSRIDVTGCGHLGGGDRAGLPNGVAHTIGFAPGAQVGAGGSYGGLGGRYAGAWGPPNEAYGNLTEPIELGSGGGAWDPYGAAYGGGDGGGRVLLGAINLVLDGNLRADGGLAAGSAAGDGSGGSLNLALRTLSGRGAISANGGTNHTGGGGGRVAIRMLDRATYAIAAVTAAGGHGYYGDGGDGTIFLQAEGQANGELVINGTGPSSPATDLVLPAGEQFDSITLQNGANVIAQGGITLSGTLRLRDGARLTHPTASEVGLSITADRVEIEAGSAIDASGRGYLGGSGAGLPNGVAHTLGATPGAEAANGGSYGGSGGHYNPASVTRTNAVYGDPRRPDALGSGGGAYSQWGGGDGGGRVRIAATAVVVDGAIRADGGLAAGSAAGDGSGGSVWIATSRLSGAGAISANGGMSHTAGGGGRVAVVADFVDPSATLLAQRRITAFGGNGYYGNGAPGTVYLELSGQTSGELVIDAGSVGATWAPITMLPPLGPGTTVAATADTLTLDGAVRSTPPGSLVGLRVNPDVTQGESFRIAASTETMLTVVTPNENGVEFGSLAKQGKRYAGAWRYATVTLRGGAQLELFDPLRVDGTLAITEAAVLKHGETTRSYEGGLDLVLGALTVDSTSAIDVTGGGHLGGGGDRAALPNGVAHTIGFAPGAQVGAGGSYGGLGGRYVGASGPPNAAYGNLTEPVELGSGGGAWDAYNGGDGGGRVRIVANTVLLDGAIRANGGLASASAAGDGSGGSVNLRSATLVGAGKITASGGGTHTGGGGGRIAIRTSISRTLLISNLQAPGAAGYYGNGGHGTVFVKDATAVSGRLVIDGFGLVQPDDSVRIPGALVLDELELRGGVRAVADDGVTVTGTLRLAGNSRLTHSGGNVSCLRIDAARVEIDATSAFDVTGRGYPGGGHSGFDRAGATLGGVAGAQVGTGGSHGGSGGRYGVGETNPPYGDLRRAESLGAGGGAWDAYDGGDGGGCVRIDADEAVVVDGAIRADGAASRASAAGDGAGGAIWITTPRLGGAGQLSANGGADHTGGGGGRITLHADTLEPAGSFAALQDVTAFGGAGYYGNGSPGTVFVQLAGATFGSLFLDAGSAARWPTPATPLPPIGPGTAAVVGADTLALDGALRVAPNGLAGLRVNPDTDQAESFVIASNTASMLTVVTPNENGVLFASVAAAGRRYAAAWRFDDVTLRRGANVELADPLRVDGTLAVVGSSQLSHPETTAAYEGDLLIDAGLFTLDASSQIDVSGRGYLGGWRSGLPGGVAHSVNFSPGAPLGAGGSYGGLGGVYGSASRHPVYGSASDPLELGSGGGAWDAYSGGDGGGRVRILADTLVLDGAIRANGERSSASAAGDGSGGAVNLLVGTLSGSGTIFADGGADHTGGGGGRIAIRASGGSSFPSANLSVHGGGGYYGHGEDGTIFVAP